MANTVSEPLQPAEAPAETAAETAAQAAPEASPKKKRKRGFKGRKKWIIPLAIAAVAAAVIIPRLNQNKNASGAADYETAAVERRTVSSVLSSSGSLAPADSYTITSLLEGDIVSANFEEGDIIEKDTVLYVIDSSDASNSIETARLSLAQAQRNYQKKLESKNDLNVKASGAGTVLSLAVDVGDSVSAGQTVATLRDSGTMSITLPFLSDDAQNFYAGQNASVTLDGSFETLSGTVTKISTATSVLSGNRIVKNVTIEVHNPGGLSNSQLATASVGGAACAQSASFTYKSESTVIAKVSGEVARLNVSEGSIVSKNQTLLVLSSDTLDDEIQNASDAVRNAELSVNSQQDRVDSYTITSPIKGTIIDKAYKAGDTLESGKTLCTIYDLSYLTMTMSIDELDINQVAVGQDVTITADAAEGKTYQGKVTKVNIQGTTTNGVTTYPVTVQIDETEGLLPGMNVDAKILVEKRENVLTVPVAAVSRGNRVLVKADQTTEKTADKKAADDNSSSQTDKSQPAVSDLPEGYQYVDVVTGISDDDYIEITSGLKEGDKIAYKRASSTSSFENAMNMGGPDGAPQDGGPQGGQAPSSGNGGGGKQ